LIHIFGCVMKSLSYSNLIYAGLGFIGLMLSFGIARAWRPRRRPATDEAPVSAAYLLREIEVLQSALAEAQRRAEDHERRVKWLERFLRQAKASQAQASDGDELVTDTSRQPRGIIERRYQVLKLARQGLGIEEISARLNLPHGEVGLILGLCHLQASRASLNLQH